MQLAHSPAEPKLRCQLPRQIGHHLFTVFGALDSPQNRAYALANVPVKQSQLGVDRAGDPLVGGGDELAHVGQQGGGGWRVHGYRVGWCAVASTA